jgi:hypothetical protein
MRDWKNGMTSKHSRRGSHGDLSTYNDDDRHDVATIINFSSSFNKGQFEKLRDS